MPTILLTHTPASRERYYGEKSLGNLRALGDVRLHDGTDPLNTDALIKAANGCDLIIADRATPVTAEVPKLLPDLCAIVRVAVDIRNIDVDAASQNGVLVTRASAGFMTSVAEIVVGYMIDMSRRITDATMAYRNGSDPEIAMGGQLKGKTIGIVGYGEIGKELGTVAAALGMSVLITDPHVDTVPSGVVKADLGDLLASSDFVICLATANDTTANLFDAAVFSEMRRSAYFINVSRGMLIDEAALKSALDEGGIAGAALDVGRAADEMPSRILARHPRVIATPHIGGLTPEAVSHQSDETVIQCGEIIAGRLPVGAVNGPQAHRLSKFAGQGGKLENGNQK